MSDLPNMQEEDDEPTAPFWMSTFSDMATLLLTFFVLLVAMSEVKTQKFEEALSHFPGRTSLLQSEAVMQARQASPNREQATAAEAAERYDELMAHLEENDLLDKVEVNLVENGIHMVITDSVMFASGQALLLPTSQEILAVIVRVLDDAVQSVVVEGHTDNQPIRTSQFPSNWELSSARAAAVVRFFIQQGLSLDPERYLAVGYGEYHPVTSNATPGGRAANRRVEILFSWEPWQNNSNPYLMRTPQ